MRTHSHGTFLFEVENNKCRVLNGRTHIATVTFSEGDYHLSTHGDSSLPMSLMSMVVELMFESRDFDAACALGNELVPNLAEIEQLLENHSRRTG